MGEGSVGSSQSLVRSFLLAEAFHGLLCQVAGELRTRKDLQASETLSERSSAAVAEQVLILFVGNDSVIAVLAILQRLAPILDMVLVHLRLREELILLATILALLDDFPLAVGTPLVRDTQADRHVLQALDASAVIVGVDSLALV